MKVTENELALNINSQNKENGMIENYDQILNEKEKMEEIQEKEISLEHEALRGNSQENAENLNEAERLKLKNILVKHFRENISAEDALSSLQKQNPGSNINLAYVENEYLQIARLSLTETSMDKINFIQLNGIEYIKTMDGKRAVYLNKSTKEITFNIEENDQLSGSSCSVFSLLDDIEDKDQYKALFKLIADYFKEHIALKNEHDYYVLAAYVVLTYSYNLFPMIPYLKIKGEKGTGKTTLLRALKGIVKNPQFASNMSTASLLRLGSDEEYTLLLDEAEMLKKRKGSNEEMIEILNSGYQKDGKVLRASGLDNIEYKTYSPKIIASIRSLAETTEDRCIFIETEQNNGKSLKDPDLTKDKAAGIKKLIQKAVINQSSEIIGNIQKGGKYGDIELKNRDRDRWNPLFVLGLSLSGAKNKIIAELTGACKNEAALKEENRRKSLEEYNISLFKEIPEDTIINGDHAHYTICDADKIAKFFMQMDINGTFRTKTGVTQFLKRHGVEVDRQRIDSKLTALYKIPNALRI